MRYRCEFCGWEGELPPYSAVLICPECKAELDDPPGEAWKRPLYERAIWLPQHKDIGRLQAMYLFLGDYRDAASRLHSLNAELERLYGAADRALFEARTEEQLSAAIEKLDAIAEYRDSAAKADGARLRLEALRQEKAAAEAAERARQEALVQRRKRIWKAVKVAIVALVIVLGIVKGWQAIAVPNRMMSRANAALKAGDYAAAVSGFDDVAGTGVMVAQAREAALKAYAEWGDSLFASGDYAGAVEKYDIALEGDERPLNALMKVELDRRTRHRLAGVMVALYAGDYSTAIALCDGDDEQPALTGADFAEAELSETPDDIRMAWSDELMAGGDVEGAMAAARAIDDDELRPRQLYALASARPDGVVRWLGGLAAQTAGEYGALFTDIDGQLLYCRLLCQAGFDLDAVYPEGVAVTLPTDALPLHAEGSGEPDQSRVLVLSRRSDAGDGKPRRFNWVSSGDDDTLAEARQGLLTHYVTRLLPGATYALGADSVPEDWEDCTAILTADQVFEPGGVYDESLYNEMVMLSTRSIDRDPPSLALLWFTKHYLYYNAWSAVQLFDRRDPAVSRVLDSAVARPKCADIAYVETVDYTYSLEHPHTELSEFMGLFETRIMATEDMLATPDEAWTQDALAKALDEIRKGREEGTP